MAGQTAQAMQVLTVCGGESSSWEYGYVHRLCHGAALPLPKPVSGAIYLLTFDPEGQRLALASDRAVFVWDYPSQSNLLTIPLACTWVQFSPEGRWLIVPYNNGVRFYDAHTGEAERTLLNLTKTTVARAALCPDGGRLVVVERGSDSSPVIDLDTGQQLFALSGHRGEVLAVAYSPDGRWLATASDTEFHIWEAATGKLTRSISSAIHGHLHPLAFSRDSRHIACIDGTRAGLWDVATGNRLVHIEGDQRIIRCLTLSLDGHLITGGSDTTIRTWDVRTGRQLLVLRGLQAQVNAVTVNPRDGSLVAWDTASNAVLLTTNCDQEARTLRVDLESRPSVAFHPESTSLATLTNKALRLLDPSTGNEVWQHTVELGEPSHVAFGGAGRWLAAGGANGLIVFDTMADLEVWQDQGRVDALAFSPEGDWLAVAGDRLTIRDAATGHERITCPDPPRRANSLSWSPDGQRFAVACEQGVLLYESATGKKGLTISHSGVQSVQFSADGNFLTACSGNAVVIWDASTGTSVRQLTQVSKLEALDFTADGQRIAAAGWDQTIAMYDFATGLPTLALPGHHFTISALEFSADGRWLASVSHDGAIRLWDAGSRERNHQQ